MGTVPDSGPWEEDYTRRGMLWGGLTHNLPDLPSRSRVLELGCGNGKTLFAMLQRGWDVTAIDFASPGGYVEQEGNRRCLSRTRYDCRCPLSPI